jgi:hypothetical protein
MWGGEPCHDVPNPYRKSYTLRIPWASITFGEYCLLAKEGATIGTAGVQAWVRGTSGGCGASSDGDARIGLYERRPLVKTTTSTAVTATTPLAK